MNRLVFRGLVAIRRRVHRNAGFTLPELLIAITIGILIMGAISTALIVTIDNEGSVQNRLMGSTASQLTSAFFTRDVQSSLAFTTAPLGLGTTPSNGPTVCADPQAPVVNGVPQGFVLGLYWASSDSFTTVSYWAPPDQPTSQATTTSPPTTTSSGSTTGGELLRETCTNDGSSSSVVLADNLWTATPVAGNPSAWDVTLTPNLAGPCAADISQCPSPASGWLPTSWVSNLDLSIATSPDNGGANGDQFNLLAAPRNQTQGYGGAPTTPSTFVPSTTTTTAATTTTASGPTTTSAGGTTTSSSTTSIPSTTSTTLPPPSASPLMLLGPTNSDEISCSGFDEHLFVGGSAYIASTAANSILLQGSGVSLTSTGHLYVKTSPASSALELKGRYGGDVSVKSSDGQGTSAATNPSGSESDPYASGTAPTMLQPGPGGPNETYNTPGTYQLAPSNYGNIDVAGSNISLTLYPGTFGSLTVSGNNNSVTLSPMLPSGTAGTYYFSGTVSIENFGDFFFHRADTPFTLSPGEYAGGIHIRGANVHVVLTTGTYIIEADPSNGVAIDDTGINNSINGTSGVLVYVSTGEVDLIGFGQSMSLAPQSGSPLVLWQAASDTDPINVEGFGSGVSSVTGTIYAPNAVLGATPQHEGGGFFGQNWWSGGASYNLGGLVAGGIVCPGFDFQLTIG